MTIQTNLRAGIEVAAGTETVARFQWNDLPAYCHAVLVGNARFSVSVLRENVELSHQIVINVIFSDDAGSALRSGCLSVF